MSVLSLAPWSLSFDSEVVAQIQAVNDYGQSEISLPSTVNARMQTTPSQVKGLNEINSETSEIQIKFTWDPLLTLEETGGSPIISYDVQWDAGYNGIVWYHLAGYSFDFKQTTYLASAKIVKGTTYKIRIRAKNYWGWGP